MKNLKKQQIQRIRAGRVILVSWRNLKRTALIGLALVIAIAAVFVFNNPKVSASGDDAYFTLSPTSGSYNYPSTITLNITETSDSGDNVNAVQANLTYPDTLLSISSISTGSSDDSPFTLEAQDTAGSGVIDLAFASSSTVSGTQNFASINFNILSSGTAAVDMVSGSGIDNTSGSSVWNGVLPTASYTLTEEPPTVTITGLSNGSFLHSNPAAIDSTATDNSGGTISNAELYFDSSLIQTITSSPYDFSLDTLNYSDGSYSLEVESTDSLSLVGTSTINVYINNGDLTNAGSVSVSDLGILADNYDKSGSFTYTQGNITNNTSGNNEVNLSDLAIMAANWGWTD